MKVSCFCGKSLKPYEKNLKNSKTTLKIHYTFTYCLKMKNFISGPCLPVNFVGLRLGFDIPEQIDPLVANHMRGYGAGIDPSTPEHFSFRDKICMLTGDDDMLLVKI